MQNHLIIACIWPEARPENYEETDLCIRGIAAEKDF
jgi:hypothetical protein